MNGSLRGMRARASSSMRRIASIAKPATSRIPTQTSPGSPRRAVAAPITRTCEGRPEHVPEHVKDTGNRTISPNRCGNVTILPYERLDQRLRYGGVTVNLLAGGSQTGHSWKIGRQLAAIAWYSGSRALADPASSGSPPSGSPISIVPIVGEQVPVKILSLRAVTMIAATIGWAFPQALAAQSQVSRDTTHITPSGNYLAARQANLERDADAASVYYRAALRTDQRNPELLELAFYSVLADGDIDEAVRLAERLIQLDRNNRNAHLVLGVKALKTKNYKEARQQFGLATRGPVTDLTATLLAGWSAFGANDTKGAIDTIDKLSGPEWYAIFKDMHAGMILDLANNKKDAGKRLDHAYKLDSSALRIMQADAGFLSRNGGREEALRIYGEFDKQLPH